jgi:Carbohydrate/starch-binding module (family 21)
MTAPVEFGLALSNSYPSGTGSYNYEGSFKIVVQKLAYPKQVSIWAQVGVGWQDIYASYLQSLPENRELWSAPATDSEGEFVAKYMVNGTTYWDNNGGMNYKFPQVFDDFAVLPGNNYKVVLGTANLAGTTLHVNVGVQNLAYDKVVGIVLSTDNWATVVTAYGHYSSTMKSGVEVWYITAPVGSATEVKLAVFYQVLGAEYWDNNFWRNYKVTPSRPQKWGDPP